VLVIVLGRRGRMRLSPNRVFPGCPALGEGNRKARRFRIN
jgi:hypothetical protein